MTALKIDDDNYFEKIANEGANTADNISSRINGVIADRVKKIGENGSISAAERNKDLEQIKQAKTDGKKALDEHSISAVKQVTRDNLEHIKPLYIARNLIPATETEVADIATSALSELLQKNETEITRLQYLFNRKYSTPDQVYIDVVNKAIYEVKNGSMPYTKAIWNTVKQLSDGAYTVANWESGYRKNLYSTVRMNLIDTIHRFNQNMLNYHGERIGSDGVELSAHAISAPDHLPVQGRQFTNEEFEKMQSGLPCEDSDGNTYEAFNRPIGMWNCKHIKFPIIIGISERKYTENQLQGYAMRSQRQYDKTQTMRKYELEIRKMKFAKELAEKSGAETERKEINRKYLALRREYFLFCRRNKLSPAII